MYTAKLSLPAIEETIDKPVQRGVVTDIKTLIGVSSDIHVIYDTVETPNGKNDTKDKLGQVRSYNSPRDEFLSVSVEEVPTDGYELSVTNNAPGTYPIYYDVEVNSKITPIIHNRSVTLTVKYFNKSKSRVNGILNKLRLMSSTDGMYKEHTLEYHYVMGAHILNLIIMINELKNLRLATAVTLEEYMTATFDNRLDYTNSLTSDALAMVLAIREAQVGVLGYISSDVNSINKDYDKDSGLYSIEFEYKFEYNKPIALIVQYPLTVYNTPVYEKYRIPVVKKLSKQGLRTKDTSPYYLKYGDRVEHLLKPKDTYIHIPIEDHTNLPDLLSAYAKLFSVCLAVDETVPNDVFYIDELPDIVFKQSILDFLAIDKDNLSLQYMSLFYFELFNGTKKVYGNDIIVTPVTEDIGGVLTDRIKLSTTLPLEITGEYRLVMNVLTDMTVMDTVSKARVLDIVKTIDFEYQAVPTSTFSNSYITLFHIETADEFIELTDYVNYS